jgi:hypothetical protein
MPEYRIEFTIQARGPDDEDFADVGFGSSGGNATVDGALYEVLSRVQNRIWETSAGMPDPDTVGREDGDL